MDLKTWRTENRLNMADAAARLGISQPTISRIESGEQLPQRATIDKMVAATKGAITAIDLHKAWLAMQAERAA